MTCFCVFTFGSSRRPTSLLVSCVVASPSSQALVAELSTRGRCLCNEALSHDVVYSGSIPFMLLWWCHFGCVVSSWLYGRRESLGAFQPPVHMHMRFALRVFPYNSAGGPPFFCCNFGIRVRVACRCQCLQRVGSFILLQLWHIGTSNMPMPRFATRGLILFVAALAYWYAQIGNSSQGIHQRQIGSSRSSSAPAWQLGYSVPDWHLQPGHSSAPDWQLGVFVSASLAARVFSVPMAMFATRGLISLGAWCREVRSKFEHLAVLWEGRRTTFVQACSGSRSLESIHGRLHN